ncbi:hypothetical protein NBRC3277_3032 [Acetobacter pasteurianus NBRC 3277]|nr:hypothetical protein NBRC3277_3032 [Acetobacter pasteurianus NBRC 3277]
MVRVHSTSPLRRPTNVTLPAQLLDADFSHLRQFRVIL